MIHGVFSSQSCNQIFRQKKIIPSFRPIFPYGTERNGKKGTEFRNLRNGTEFRPSLLMNSNNDEDVTTLLRYLSDFLLQNLTHVFCTFFVL